MKTGKVSTSVENKCEYDPKKKEAYLQYKSKWSYSYLYEEYGYKNEYSSGKLMTSVGKVDYTNDVKLVVEGATGTVRWDVDDPSICKVTNGVITAKKYGTTKVTATINGRTLTCTVKVVR